MKTKNKTIALLEIAVVLCSVFLVALPATGIAADQNVQQAMQKVNTLPGTQRTSMYWGIISRSRL